MGCFFISVGSELYVLTVDGMNEDLRFDPLFGFSAVISFQMAGHCVLSVTLVYWTRAFDIISGVQRSR